MVKTCSPSGTQDIFVSSWCPGFSPSASGFEVHWTLICTNSKKAKIGSSGVCISAPSVNAEGFITAQQTGNVTFRLDVLSAAKTCELCKGSLVRVELGTPMSHTHTQSPLWRPGSAALGRSNLRAPSFHQCVTCACSWETFLRFLKKPAFLSQANVFIRK